jgi:hypothetical protein
MPRINWVIWESLNAIGINVSAAPSEAASQFDDRSRTLKRDPGPSPD